MTQTTTKRGKIKGRLNQMVLIPQRDIKQFITCCFALIWLEVPEGEVFIRIAERLINKYQKMT